MLHMYAIKFMILCVKLNPLFPAKLVLMAIPQKRVHRREHDARTGKVAIAVIYSKYLVEGVVARMLQTIRIIMIFLQNRYLVVVAGILGVFKADIYEMVGIGKDILKLVAGATPQNCGYRFGIPFRMREEIQMVFGILKTIYVMGVRNF